jgi:hypothetical protein
MEIQFFRRGSRRDGLKARRGLPIGIMAESLTHAHSGNKVKYLNEGEAGDKTTDMGPESDASDIFRCEACRE